MQPTVYSYPLNQSINAFTEFSATYDTDTLNSWYKINSEGITIGEEGFTKQIHFNCTDFANIIFNQRSCDEKSGNKLELSVKTLYDLSSMFSGIGTREATFGYNIVFKGNAVFDKTASFKTPSSIIFKQADIYENLNLTEYISKHSWIFTDTISFKGDENINIGNDNLKKYVEDKIGELAKFKIVICKEAKIPDVETADFNTIYLVPDKVPGTTYYKEYIKVVEEDKTIEPPYFKQWMEEIGSTKVDLTGYLKKDESNELPNYGEESEYTGKPGIMFDDVFYNFENLDDTKYIKIDGGNNLPQVPGHKYKPGIEFEGIFYSFDGLAKKDYNGPLFQADGSEIIQDANGFLIYTAGTKSSVVIKPKVSSYIILDAAVLDENSQVWSEINSISKDGSQVVVDFNDVTNGKSWLYIKTLCIANGSNPNIYDSIIFLRKNSGTQVPTYIQSNIEFEYSYDNSYYIPVANNEIIINDSHDKLNVKTSYYAILDAHLVSTNGLTSLKGINGNTVYMNVNSTARGTDYLALKLLFFVNEENNKGAYVTDRVIRITKSN